MSASRRGSGACKCLARGGRLVTCGATTGYDARIDLRFLFARQYLADGLLHGHVKPSCCAPRSSSSPASCARSSIEMFPLAEAAEAHRRLESREAFGKVVLTV